MSARWGSRSSDGRAPSDSQALAAASAAGSIGPNSDVPALDL